MLRAVIIDDEPYVIKTIQFMLKKYCPQLIIAGTAESAQSGKNLIDKQNPDLVFLDIEMPYGNGFEMLNSMHNINFQLIFISAFDQYAAKAFKFSAVDYILKPVDKDELQAAVDKACTKIRDNESIGALKYNIDASNPLPLRIAIATLRGLIFVVTSDILYCQSDGNYTHIHMVDGTQYLSSRPIGDYENLLANGSFYRVHHAYIINLNHVAEYIKGRGGYILLRNGKSIDVSVRKKEGFLKKFRLIK